MTVVRDLANASIAPCRRAGLVGIDHAQRHDIAVDQQLSGIFEIDGDAPADDRLHLPQAPFRLLRMDHESARRQRLRRVVAHRRSLNTLAAGPSFSGVEASPWRRARSTAAGGSAAGRT